MPPVKPMLAKAVAGIPNRPDLTFEPKWDGFRCIVFRDADEVELGSRNERPLTRYFPEVLEPLRQQLPERCVVDGELIVITNNELDFNALQLRLHPAESRVNKLAGEIPAILSWRSTCWPWETRTFERRRSRSDAPDSKNCCLE